MFQINLFQCIDEQVTLHHLDEGHSFSVSITLGKNNEESSIYERLILVDK